MALLWIIAGFALLRFMVVLANLVTRPWLRPGVVDGNARVSVLIPARNEEGNIERLLHEVLKSDGNLIHEILVYNDQSTDGTGAAVSRVSRDADGVRLIEGTGLEPGWLGKNQACHRLAMEATGDWLLFLDADVHVKPELIRDAVALARRRKLRLLSLFPKQVMLTPGEWMVVPLMNWILLSLLPLFLVRTCRWSAFSAANGQFMLFDATIYSRFCWHEQVKSDPVEDIRISRLMKRKRFRTATLLSAGQIECRMYGSYSEALAGFSRNICQFFGNSITGMLLYVALTTVLPIMLMALPFLMPEALLPAVIWVFLVAGIRLVFSLISRQNLFLNVGWWLPQQISLLILAWKSIRYRLGSRLEWKGRKI